LERGGGGSGKAGGREPGPCSTTLRFFGAGPRRRKEGDTAMGDKILDATVPRPPTDGNRCLLEDPPLRRDPDPTMTDDDDDDDGDGARPWPW